MKYFLMTLMVFCNFLISNSQEVANIIVGYDAKKWDSQRDSVINQTMTLLLNKDFSKYLNELSLWSDSIGSTPEGVKRLNELIMAQCVIRNPDGTLTVDYSKGPIKKLYTYVLTDKEKRELTHYGKWGNEQRYYNEPLDEMIWEVGDSTANILGYECVLAETDYHGRHWKAWFTPEIPVSFGPWKLRGLPGLILSADAGEGFGFQATSIESTDRLMTPIYNPELNSKTERKKALADEEYYQNYRRAILSAQYGGNIQFTSGFDDGPKYDGKKYSLEPDYKK